MRVYSLILRQRICQIIHICIKIDFSALQHRNQSSSHTHTHAWTIIGCVTLSLAPKCIRQPSGAFGKAQPNQSRNRHMNKCDCPCKLNSTRLERPGYYRGCGFTFCSVRWILLSPAWKVSSHCFTNILRSSSHLPRYSLVPPTAFARVSACMAGRGVCKSSRSLCVRINFMGGFLAPPCLSNISSAAM